ncbi:sodium:alanine symporter family protein [Enterorhabdus sp. P55]|jgi:AGCS family alanine or glycine:cation symporter|uniref:alanine/glycine:cation symporter family protein n=1 Tax=Enterorhabdus sp. P55 TaxID=2304571 RepID=UPI00136D204B|nr:amino acid carrier protein [Enterorhabdus sp. P55]MCI8452878.1 sodium:alanine symporter family protein [Eggerthellaceae bacterium]NBI31944.1 sodium:alanine symporter family protein [Enterorhabdus sp. P55]
MIETLQAIDAFVWGPPMIVLLLGTHLFLTARTGFIQRKLPQAIRLSFRKDPEGRGDISNFGALATALAATIGTGSIVGVATAVLAGGPGAVFWMWVTGIFGMATKYVEVFASIRYRVRDHNGNMLGGAMYVWERAFKRADGTVPWWAKLGAGAFAAFAVVATIGTGSAVQASAMTGVITSSLPVPAWAVGLVIVVLVAAVIFGGVRSIASVCETLVPVMAVAYAGGCLIILALNWAVLGDALALIFACAFTAKAAFGGAVGSGIVMALQFGCARGLFSNESGLGSAPIVAAAARTRNPAEQALVAMTGTFWSTVVICALTGVVLVSTMLTYPEIQEEILASPSVYTGAALASAAFAKIPYVGTPVLVIGMVAFSYSTILGWSYYGNRCVTYLLGRRAILPYQVAYVAVAFLGAVGVGDVVWTVSDIGNALMALPNIVAILLLSGLIARETRHYIYDDHLDEVCERPIPVLEGK